MKTASRDSEPEAYIVHLRCPKCNYPAAIEGYEREEKKYVSMCLKSGCHHLMYHDTPHEQRSSNGGRVI